MEVLVEAQWVSALLALLFGVLAGALYDVLRILRILCGAHSKKPQERSVSLSLPFLPKDFFLPKPKGKRSAVFSAIFVFFCDLLWFSAVGALFSVFVYWQNDGIFRFYILLCAVMGFILYYKTVGRLVLLVAESVALVLRIVLFYIALLIAMPFRLLWITFQKSRQFVDTFILLPYRSRKEMRRLLRLAEEGGGLSWHFS